TILQERPCFLHYMRAVSLLPPFCYTLSTMKPHKTILHNGLRIITVPMKGNETVAVYVLADTGTEYERTEENGISHFLEHVCFKGTEKRPTALAITKEFDGIGAYVN